MIGPSPSRRGSSSYRSTFMVVLLLCFYACAAAQSSQKHQTKHDEKRQVEAMEEQWRMAQLSGDIEVMGKMLSDDFIGISMSGQVNTKAQQLERIRTHKLVITKIKLDEMKVKLVDSVAIVTCLAEVEGTSEGMSMKGLYRYTRVYQHLPSGEWKITNFEATRIRPKKPMRGE